MLEVFREHSLLAEFLESFDKAITGLASYETNQSLMRHQDGEIKFQGDELADEKGVSKLLVDTFRKLSGILLFIKETLRLKALEYPGSGSIDSIEVLFKLSLFDKYVNSQQFIHKGLTLMKDHLQSDIEWNPVLRYLSFTALNRQNKQKFSTLLDEAKQMPGKQSLVQALENIMFAAQEQDQKAWLRSLKTQFARELITAIDGSIEGPRPSQLGKQLKLTILERSLRVRELFGLSFDTSLFFERGCYHFKSVGHPLGLTNGALDRYAELKQAWLER